jgi:hypothetical protein
MERFLSPRTAPPSSQKRLTLSHMEEKLLV